MLMRLDQVIDTRYICIDKQPWTSQKGSLMRIPHVHNIKIWSLFYNRTTDYGGSRGFSCRNHVYERRARQACFFKTGKKVRGFRNLSLTQLGECHSSARTARFQPLSQSFQDRRTDSLDKNVTINCRNCNQLCP